MKSKEEEIKEEIEEIIKQLKVDLGILPYSDISQPEKFASMSMKDVEENIDDFKEVLLEKLKSSLTGDGYKKAIQKALEIIEERLNKCKNMIVNIPIYTLEKNGRKIKTPEEIRQLCAEILDDYQKELIQELKQKIYELK